MILWAYNAGLGVSNACTASTLIGIYVWGIITPAFWVALVLLAISLSLMVTVNIRELWWKPRKAKKENHDQVGI